jgi:hypothetical protein
MIYYDLNIMTSPKIKDISQKNEILDNSAFEEILQKIPERGCITFIMTKM